MPSVRVEGELARSVRPARARGERRNDEGEQGGKDEAAASHRPGTVAARQRTATGVPTSTKR